VHGASAQCCSLTHVFWVFLFFSRISLHFFAFILEDFFGQFYLDVQVGFKKRGQAG
jgi:hypothetical protein